MRQALALVCVGSMLLGGCTSGKSSSVAEDTLSPEAIEQGQEMAAPEPSIMGRMPAAQKAAPSAPSITAPSLDAVEGAPTPDNSIPRQTPQLIKNADLVIKVTSISENLPKITQLLSQFQGDVLSLQENRVSDVSTTATLQLRVPQASLEALLTKLIVLGQVESRSITAQDVSGQLVDYQARLRNLRRTEESVLAILNRSGTISQVLEVTRELNSIRTQIEQLTGELSRLQNQVSYSRINLQLLEDRPTIIISPSLAEQLGMTWQEAGQSLGQLGVATLKKGIWVIVYSPFVLIPLAGLWWWRRRG